jgi:hypothetical protein
MPKKITPEPVVSEPLQEWMRNAIQEWMHNAIPEWMRDATKVAPDSLVRDIASAPSIPTSASLIPDRVRSADAPRPASGGTTPIQSPPGINICDGMMDAQDRIDKLSAMKVKLETDWLQFQLEQAREPKIETDYEPFDRDNMKR